MGRVTWDSVSSASIWCVPLWFFVSSADTAGMRGAAVGLASISHLGPPGVCTGVLGCIADLQHPWPLPTKRASSVVMRMQILTPAPRRGVSGLAVLRVRGLCAAGRIPTLSSASLDLGLTSCLVVRGPGHAQEDKPQSLLARIGGIHAYVNALVCRRGEPCPGVCKDRWEHPRTGLVTASPLPPPPGDRRQHFPGPSLGGCRPSGQGGVEARG